MFKSIRLIFGISLATISIVFGWLFYIHISHTYDRYIGAIGHEHLSHVLNVSAQMIQPAIDFDDEKEIKRIIDIFGRQHDVALIAMYNAHKNLKYASGEAAPHDLDSFIMKLPSNPANSNDIQIQSNQNYILGAKPLFTQLGVFKGYLGVKFSTDLISKTRTAVLKSWIIVISLFFIISAAVFALISRHAVISVIGVLSASAKSITEGDLTAKMPEPKFSEFSEIAESFNNMLDALRSQIINLHEMSNTLMERSIVMQEAASNLAASASEQATATSETVVTVEELKSTSSKVHQMAQQIAENAAEAMKVAEEGRSGIIRVVETMKQISTSGADVKKQIENLNSKMQSIGEITETVKDIAERSNILAINAAIEAAKAGEYGRGFAVVADEIKALADQSKQGTLHVMDLLKELEGGKDMLVSSINRTNESIAAGTEVLSDTSEKILTLISQVESNVADAQQISTATNQQLIGMEQIAQAVQNIAEASKPTSESAEHVKETGEELASIASKLKEWVSRYKFKA